MRLFICQRCISLMQPILRQHQQMICWLSVKTVSQLSCPKETGKERRSCYKIHTLSSGRNMSAKEISNDINLEFLQKKVGCVDSIYVWGNGGTGALGMKKLFGNVQPSPHRLELKNGHLPLNVSLGYGFTVFWSRTQNRSSVYGCGLNTSRQLGIQSNPDDPDHFPDFIMEPALININLNNEQSGRQSQVVDISCGKAHTWIVTDDNKVFSFGSNAYGQCGKPANGHNISRCNKSFLFHEKIKQVCCGLDHTLVLTTDGNVYSCGLGADGQTGLGHYKAVDTLTLVCGDIKGEKIISISSKADTVLAVSEKGDVFGWGNSEYGQFSAAIGDEMQVNTPRHLPFLQEKTIRQAAAAGTMCGLLDDEGKVYIWGYGALGRHHIIEQTNVPQLVDRCSFGAKQMMEDFHVTQLSCGLTHFAAVTELGELYMWGKQRMHCLGSCQSKDDADILYTPTKVDVPAHVISTSCGIDHSCAVCVTRN